MQLLDRKATIYGTGLVSGLYIALVSTAILGDIFYWTVSKSFAGYAKIFFYSALAVVIVDFIIQKNIVLQKFTIAMFVCLLIGLTNGVLKNPVEKEFFAHFSPFILSIFAYSYGYRSEILGGKLTSKIDSNILLAGVILTGLVCFYYWTVEIGYVPYFGAGALFAYPIFYAVSKGCYKYATLFYCANIFTGKRSIFVAISVVLLIYFIRKGGRAAKRWLMVAVVVLAIMIAALICSGINLDLGLKLHRYINVFEYLSENDDVLLALDLATSGRVYDAVAAFDRIGKSLVNWFFGLGFGSTFSVTYSFSEEPHVTHYSHFTPVSFLLIGGVLLFGVVYGKLLFEVKRAYQNYDDHLSMMVLYYFIMGFSGAIFFTDTFVWLLIGCFSARKYATSSV